MGRRIVAMAMLQKSRDIRRHCVIDGDMTCMDATAAQRLGGREIGQELEQHVESSRRMAAVLTDGVEATTARIATDDRTVADIAADVIACTGWLP